MAKRGPTPIPTAIKILRGNPGGRPLNKREPKPRAGIPKCPAWLSETAREYWGKTAKELRAMGVLTLADGEQLAAYCQICARLQIAEEHLNTDGQVISFYDEKGRCLYAKASPYVAIAQNLLQLLNRYATDFGLNPSARTRIQVEKPGVEAAEFERFLSSKTG